MLPVIAFAGAGKFIDLAEIEPIDKLLIPKEFTINGSTIIVKVAGASMEPMIRKGAYIGEIKMINNLPRVRFTRYICPMRVPSLKEYILI